MKINISKSKKELAKNFARYLAQIVTSKQEVHLALSGGSTPKIVFDELVANFQNDIDWSHVHLYWGDERCVPPDDEQSNYQMTVRHLTSKINIPSTNIHRIKGELPPKSEAERYSDLLLKQLPVTEGIPKFDIVILGMGDDGHTASIFPHEIELWQSDKLCEVAVHPESGQQRISLTGKVINAASLITFLVTGKSKQEKVREILKKEHGFKKYPASLVSPISGKLIWFLDEEAAGKLD